MILKGHLLVEELLREYVNFQFPQPKALLDARLTFHQNLCLAKASSKNEENKKLWGVIEKLNGLRNKLAHSLDPAEIDLKINDFVKSLSNFDSGSSYIDSENKFGTLTTCILTICLSLSALLKNHRQHGN